MLRLMDSENVDSGGDQIPAIRGVVTHCGDRQTICFMRTTTVTFCIILSDNASRRGRRRSTRKNWRHCSIAFHYMSRNGNYTFRGRAAVWVGLHLDCMYAIVMCVPLADEWIYAIEEDDRH